MTSPIDPIRRAAHLRRAQRGRVEDAADAGDLGDHTLPVPYAGPVETPPPPGSSDAAAAFSAHILGQDGQKRGLRGGPAVLDAAKSAYGRTEWSGSADRRARRGGSTRTEI